MSDLISRHAAIEVIKNSIPAYISSEDTNNQYLMGCIDGLTRARIRIKGLPSAQPEKCSDILDELKADDYYNYIHTGHSRFSEDDWDYLIHNATEKEKLHERLDKQTGGD